MSVLCISLWTFGKECKLKKYLDALPDARCLGDLKDGSDDWHMIRSQGIGGSDIGTIVGLNPWESAYTLFHKRQGNIEDSVEENWSIRFGKAFEQPILDLYQEEHPDEEVFTTGTFVNEQHSWMHANPDALAKVNGEWKIIEVKTARAGWSELPAHYEAQVMWYMKVTGIRKAVVVAVAGMTYNEYEVEYNEFAANLFQEKAEKFWESLKLDQPPNWDGAKSTYETERKLHPEIEDRDADIPWELWSDLELGLQNQAQVDAHVNKAKSRILAHMGNARYGHVNGQRVVSRQARGKGAPYLVITK